MFARILSHIIIIIYVWSCCVFSTQPEVTSLMEVIYVEHIRYRIFHSITLNFVRWGTRIYSVGNEVVQVFARVFAVTCTKTSQGWDFGGWAEKLSTVPQQNIANL